MKKRLWSSHTVRFTDQEEYLNVGQSHNLAVSQGLIQKHSFVYKFGNNEAIATGPEDIWEAGGTYSYDTVGTAPIVSLVSDSLADTVPITVQGLDINGDMVLQTLTLTGTARVALTTPLWRVYRMFNSGSTNIAGTVYCYVGTGGVPSLANTRAVIMGANNQTLMAIYTIPKGKVAFLGKVELGIEFSGNPSSATEYAHFHIETRQYGKVFRVGKSLSLMISGTSEHKDRREYPEPLPSLTDIRLRVIEVSEEMGAWGTFTLLLVDEDIFDTEFLQSIGQPGY